MRLARWQRMTSPRMLRLLGYAALGPITGPLVAGVVRNLSAGNPVLAFLYGVAIFTSMSALAAVTSNLALKI